MRASKTDRTAEVERRIAAIRINPDDECVFFQFRDGCLIPEKCCRFCRFAVFSGKSSESAQGLCKFKR